MEQSKSVLVKIKSLEKLIFRSLFCECSEKMDLPSLTQMQIIEYMLRHRNEDVFQKDLESVLNLRRSTVSGVLKTMEKNHLIKRIIKENDGRVKKIFLDKRTVESFLEHKRKFLEIDDYITQGIDKDDLILFNRVIDRMKDNLKEYNVKKQKGI